MKLEEAKSFWWFLLASCAGMDILFAMLIAGGARRAIIAGLAAETCAAAVAVWKLKNLYQVWPAPWTGRWQLRLSDMLSIMFFFGALMLVTIQATSTSNLQSMAIVFGLGLGYAASLLFLSRLDADLRGLLKWISAVGVLYSAILMVAAGMLVQLAALGLAALLVPHLTSLI